MIPINYNLVLHPDLDTKVFTGNETITILCQKKTTEIFLHSLGLNIISVEILELPNINISMSLNPVTEFLKIELSNELIENEKYNLFLSFEGSMKNKIVGLYTSSYLTNDETYK